MLFAIPQIQGSSGCLWSRSILIMHSKQQRRGPMASIYNIPVPAVRVLCQAPGAVCQVIKQIAHLCKAALLIFYNISLNCSHVPRITLANITQHETEMKAGKYLSQRILFRPNESSEDIILASLYIVMYGWDCCHLAKCYSVGRAAGIYDFVYHLQKIRHTYNQPPGKESKVAKYYFVVAPTFSGTSRT